MLFINLVTKLLVGLVDVALSEDVEGGAHQSEESRVEVDRPVRVEGHVHRDQALQARDYDLYLGCDWLPCKPHDEDRAFQSRAGERFSWGNIEGLEKRRHKPQKSDHINVLDEPFGIGIIFAPQVNKLRKMVWTKDGPIS